MHSTWQAPAAGLAHGLAHGPTHAPASSSGPAPADPAHTGRLVADLAGAAQRCELELHLQPEVRLESGELTGAEALLRWYHPSEGLFWPADLLPLAQAGGLSAELAAWVVVTAAAAALAWPDAAADASRTCWVNLPVQEAAQTAVGALGAVRRLGLPAGRLGLHAPINALSFDPSSASCWVAESRAGGIPVLADGVGANHNDPRILASALDVHLEALMGLAVSGIVLSRQCVRLAALHPLVADQVGRTCAVAAARGWDVSAVGVETWEEAAVLREYGVTRATGHLFGAPVREDRLRWMLGVPGEAWRGSFVADELADPGAGRGVLSQEGRLARTHGSGDAAPSLHDARWALVPSGS
jgi:EAL domain-containing protein (putative c-di-GMP-specific phosphodiesterase class I)